MIVSEPRLTLVHNLRNYTAIIIYSYHPLPSIPAPTTDAPMDPFFCVDKQALRKQGIMRLTDAQVNGPELCFLVKPTKFKPIFFYPLSLSLYVIPYWNSVVHCECPRDQLNSGCNDRNFLINLFYDMDREDMTKPIMFALNLQRHLIADPINGDLKMQQAVTQAAGAIWNLCPMAGPAFSNTTLPGNNMTSEAYMKKSWAALCPWKSCAAFLLSSNQDAAGQTFLPLNEFMYQARNAPWLNHTYTSPSGTPRRREMCENTIYNAAMMDAFIANPPTLLVEQYFQCTLTTRWVSLIPPSLTSWHIPHTHTHPSPLSLMTFD